MTQNLLRKTTIHPSSVPDSYIQNRPGPALLPNGTRYFGVMTNPKVCGLPAQQNEVKLCTQRARTDGLPTHKGDTTFSATNYISHSSTKDGRRKARFRNQQQQTRGREVDSKTKINPNAPAIRNETKREERNYIKSKRSHSRNGEGPRAQCVTHPRNLGTNGARLHRVTQCNPQSWVCLCLHSANHNKFYDGIPTLSSWYGVVKPYLHHAAVSHRIGDCQSAFVRCSVR